MKNTLVLILTLIALVSCNQSKIEIDSIKPTSSGGSAPAPTVSNLVTVTNVDVVSNQLVISGTDLDTATSVRVTGPSGFDETFAIESQSSGSLVANSLSNLAVIVDGLFNLIISNAHGAATYSISFQLQDGQVTAAKLNDMGASAGDVLTFDGSNWGPAPLTGLTFKGTFDATSVADQTTVGAAAGHYYIVTVAGSRDPDGVNNGNTFSIGDWAVYNGATSQWDKVIGTNDVVSVAGKQGVVTLSWADFAKTGSLLSDIANVDVTGRADGDILVWNNAGSRWEAQAPVDTNSNAATLCTGSNVLLGDGSCVALPVDTDTNTNAATICSAGEYLDGDGTCKTAGTTSLAAGSITSGSGEYLTYQPDGTACGAGQILVWNNINTRWECGNKTVDTDTNTNAGTICSAGEYLDGDGTCKAIPVDTDTDTTYTAGSGLNLSGTTFSIPAQGVTNTMISGVAANCSSGEVLKANGTGGFTCQADNSTSDSTTLRGEALDSDLATDTTTDGQILVWSQTNSQWEVAPAPTDNDTTYSAGTGLTLTTGTFDVDVGTGANKIPQLDGSADLSIDGSLLLSNDLFIRWGASYISGHGGNNNMRFHTNGVERMRLQGERLGVGNTSPQGIFHVSNGSARVKLENDANGVAALAQDMPGLELIQDGNQNTGTQQYGYGIKFMAGDNAFTTEAEKFTAGIFPVASESYTADTQGGTQLHFLTTPNNPGANSLPNTNMVLDQDGNLRVGTGNSVEKLGVEGRIALRETTAPTNTADYGKLYVKSSDGKLYFMDDAGTETDLTATGGSADDLGDHTATQNIQLGTNWLSGDGGNEGVYVDGTGQVGIGTSSPSVRFHIADTASDNVAMRFQDDDKNWFFSTSTNEGFGIYEDSTGSTPPFNIEVGGNVGIGITNPTEKLTVDGNINVTSGNDICIDGSGCLSSAVAGGGENNTGSNVGTGAGPYKGKSSTTLQFRSIASTGSTITVTENTDDINLEVNSVGVDKIASGSGLYFTYQPNNSACTNGQVLKWVTASTRWECADDTDTDTTYSAGNGIDPLLLAGGDIALDLASGSGLTFTTGELDVDNSVIQDRVSGTCAAGSSIRVINADGTVTCETDDNSQTWSLNGSNAYYDSGNVSVGTDTPLGTMHVEDSDSTITAVTSTPNSTLFITRDHTPGEPSEGSYGAILGFGNNRTHTLQTAAIAVKQTTGDPDQSGLAFFTQPAGNIGTNLTEQLVITHDGKVGIGSGDPFEDMVITKADKDTAINLQNSSSTAARFPKVMVTNFDGAGLGGHPQFYGVSYRGDSSSPSPVQTGDVLAEFMGGGATNSSYGSASGAGISIIANENFTPSATSGILSFYTVNPGTNSGSEKMRIEADGKIGVGTSSPQNFVHLVNETSSNDLWHEANIDASSSGPDYVFQRSRGTNGSKTAVQNGNKIGGLRFQGWDGTAYETGAEITAYAEADSSDEELPTQLRFITRKSGDSFTSERMRITGAGRVGIGTTSPSALLTISGQNEDIHHYSNSATASGAPDLKFYRSRGSEGSPTAVQDNDWLGSLRSRAYDGDEYYFTGGIFFKADGTIANNTVPTRIEFHTHSTTANDSREVMRIGSDATVTMEGQLSLKEGTAPSQTANYGKVYVKSSDSKLYFMDDSGTEFDLTSGGAGGGVDGVTSTADATAITINSSEQVGIGTGSPSESLEVVGTIKASAGSVWSSNGSTGTSRGLLLENYDDTANANGVDVAAKLGGTEFQGLSWTQDTAWTSGSVDGDKDASLSFGVLRDNVAENPMILTSSGSLGLGTSNPLADLHVRDNDDFAFFYLQSDEDYSISLLEGNSNVDWQGGFFTSQRARGTSSSKLVPVANDYVQALESKIWDGDTYENSGGIITKVDGTVSDGVTPLKIEFYTEDTAGAYAERMVIRNNGRVGIGNSNPLADLEVSGGAGSSSGIHLVSSTDSNNPRVKLRTSNSNDHGMMELLDNTETVQVSLRSSASSFMTGGNLGIGTSSPDSKAILDLNSTDQGFLPPRMTAAQRSGISSPPTGLMVYNTDTDNLNLFDGSTWQTVGSGGGGGSSSSLDAADGTPTSAVSVDNEGDFIVGTGEGTGTLGTGVLRGPAATGTDITGSNLFFDASAGTGTGGSGNLVFRTGTSGSISVGNTSSQTSSGNNVTSLSWSHTIASGSNRILVVFLGLGDNEGVSGVTYDGSALTKLVDINNPGDGDGGDIWYLVAPNVGTANIVVTKTDGKMVGSAIDFTGADQSTPFRTGESGSSASATSSSESPTSSLGDIVVDMIVSDPGDGAGTPTSGQTAAFSGNSGGTTSSNVQLHVGYKNAGTPTTTSSYSMPGTNGFGHHAVAIRPGGSGTSQTTLVEAMRITPSGSVGIGTSSPDQKLSVNGNASKTSGGTWAVFSDARLKTVTGKYVRSLEALREVDPVFFHYNKDNPLGIQNTEEQVGFVAQEIQKVIPEAVEELENGYLQLQSDAILWTMLNSIKDLDKMFGNEHAERMAMLDSLQSLEKQVKENTRAIASLEEKVEDLEKENKDLKEKNAKLEERLRKIEKALGIE